MMYLLITVDWYSFVQVGCMALFVVMAIAVFRGSDQPFK